MKVDKQLPVTNVSSREGARIHLLSLHTVEGDVTLESLQSILQNGGVSCHYGSDKHGRIAQYAKDRDKAWTQCNYNPVCLSLEQAGFAEYSRKDWFERHAQLHAAAEFCAYGFVHYGVPIRRGQVANGGVIREGIVQHKDLGIIGCGHSDCGDGYPQKYVMLLARYFIADKLHPDAPHTRRLRKEVNNIREYWGVKQIGGKG